MLALVDNGGDGAGNGGDHNNDERGRYGALLDKLTEGFGGNKTRAYTGVLSVCFRALALLFVVFAVAALIGRVVFLTQGVEAQGVVVGFHEVPNAAPFGIGGSASTTRFYPIVAYQAAGAGDGGNEYQVTLGSGGLRKRVEIGQEVGLLYRRGMPGQAIAGSFGGKWYRVLVFGFLAGFFALLGVLAPFAFRSGPQAKAKQPQSGNGSEIIEK